MPFWLAEKAFLCRRSRRLRLLKQELDLAEAKRKITAFIKTKVEEAKSDGAVIGISGGIDSAVTAYLTVEALGSRRVMGLIMPDLRVTADSDVQDAKAVADELSLETKMLDIAPIHGAFMKNLKANRVAEGNLRARIRMSLLYYFANSMNRLVVGTGDRSEEILGYFTKYGDGGVDLLPIADLYKTEVRKLGEILGVRRRIISKRSSPSLWPGQTAEGELGLSYESIDTVFKMYFDQKLSVRTISSRLKIEVSTIQNLVSHYHETRHKREMPQICKLR
jgi:NAD+ synthase